MEDDIADEFDALAEQLIEQTESIDCPNADFYAGLRSIIRTLNDRLELEAYDKKISKKKARPPC